MIVLRKIKRSSNVAIAESLFGNVDGVNRIFTAPHNFKSDKISVFFNGQELVSPHDFEITGSNEITFIYIAPDNKDVLNATYEVE